MDVPDVRIPSIFPTLASGRLLFDHADIRAFPIWLDGVPEWVARLFGCGALPLLAVDWLVWPGEGQPKPFPDDQMGSVAAVLTDLLATHRAGYDLFREHRRALAAPHAGRPVPVLGESYLSATEGAYTAVRCYCRNGARVAARLGLGEGLSDEQVIQGLAERFPQAWEALCAELVPLRPSISATLAVMTTEAWALADLAPREPGGQPPSPPQQPQAPPPGPLAQGLLHDVLDDREVISLGLDAANREIWEAGGGKLSGKGAPLARARPAEGMGLPPGTGPAAEEAPPPPPGPLDWLRRLSDDQRGVVNLLLIGEHPGPPIPLDTILNRRFSHIKDEEGRKPALQAMCTRIRKAMGEPPPAPFRLKQVSNALRLIPLK